MRSNRTGVWLDQDRRPSLDRGSGPQQAHNGLRRFGEPDAADMLPADCPYALGDLLADDRYPANRRGLPDDRQVARFLARSPDRLPGHCPKPSVPPGERAQRTDRLRVSLERFLHLGCWHSKRVETWRHTTWTCRRRAIWRL